MRNVPQFGPIREIERAIMPSPDELNPAGSEYGPAQDGPTPVEAPAKPSFGPGSYHPEQPGWHPVQDK